MTTRAINVRGVDVAVVDALLATGIALDIAIESWVHPDIAIASRVVTVLAAVLIGVAVATRRWWPAGALIAGAAVPTVQAVGNGALNVGSGLGVIVALMLLAYSAGSRLELRRALLALGAGALAFTGFVISAAATVSAGIGSELFIVAIAFVAPWSAGRVARRRERRTVAFEELASQTAAQREERVHVAIAEERLRISGELQDIIAHSVSAMVIQAAAARGLLTTDPARARESIATVEDTGRETLADLRRLLGVLRKDNALASLAPQPGVGQIDTLVGACRGRGMVCELAVLGSVVDLTPGIDLVAYRVIESALTFATTRHSNRAAVTVTYAPDALGLSVRAEGAVPNLDQDLDGLPERVALYDGNLHVRQTQSGFELTGDLPFQTGVPA